MTSSVEAIVAALRAQGDPDAVAGMARYGITGPEVFGVKVPVLRRMARDLGRDHALAEQLWHYPSRETRVLASMVDRWQWVNEAQMERWAADFDSWEICDQACGNLFAYTPHAIDKAVAWSARPDTFVKRAGFVLMADLAHRDKQTADEQLLAFLPIIEREAADDRNYVKKAANWALRDIGKRNPALNAAAVATAERLVAMDAASARWNGRDALRELTSDAVQARLARR